MYSLSQFMTETQGTLVASRGGITGQCVSLVQKWSEVNGVSGTPVFPVANAKDMGPNTRQDAFTWIPAPGIPQPGDIVVFSWNHTGLCEGSDGYTMTLFQQNDPTGSTVHSKNYSFSGCTGWLRLKGAAMSASQDKADETTIQLAYNIGLNRAAGQDEINMRLNSGQSEEAMLRDLAGSQEFRDNQALMAAGANAASLQKQLTDVRKQYQDLLNKPGVQQDSAQAAAEELRPAVGWLKRLINFLRS